MTLRIAPSYASCRGRFESLEVRNLLTTVSLEPSSDNSLFEDAQGTLSNGVGEFLFAGRTKQSPGRSLRRAAVKFDLAGQIPAGATINSVSLSLTLSKSISSDVSMGLHRLTEDWGEGVSNANGPEGKGTDATPGDTTWTHRNFPTEPWSTNGGTFESVASASTSVGAINQAYTWTSDEMISDVSAWLDDPDANFGWIVIGDEATDGTAKRFNSRENSDAATRPTLTIDFTEPQSLPTLSIKEGAAIENGTDDVSFEISLSEAPAETVSVDFTTQDGTATAGNDFVAQSGTLQFGPNNPLTQTVTIQVVDNNVTEADEQFSLLLQNPVGAELVTNMATGSIVDNDPQPTIRIGDLPVDEGMADTSTAVLLVQLSNPSAFEITVDYETTAETAQANDFVSTSGTLTFAPGEVSAAVSVEVVGDTEFETDETVLIRLSNPSAATIDDALATLTIRNDDVSSTPWQNLSQPLDTDGDQGITASDVLLIIQYINANGAGAVPVASGPGVPPPFYDVTGDNQITPRDALAIINFINTEGPVNPPQATRDLAFALMLSEDDDKS